MAARTNTTHYPVGAPVAQLNPAVANKQQLVAAALENDDDFIGEEHQDALIGAQQGGDSDSERSGSGSEVESGMEDGGAPEGSAPIANHMSRREQRAAERIRKDMKKPHRDESLSIVRLTLEATISPADLAAGRDTMKINPKAAQKFLRSVADPSTGAEVRIGDVSRAQFKTVRLLGIQNELPISVGLECPFLEGYHVCKTTSGNNGLDFPYVARKQSSVDFTLLKGGEGKLLYENLNLINERLFSEWGSVDPEELTRGITPISGTDESILDIDQNKRIVDIIYENWTSFQREFPKFSYKELARDVKRGRRKVRVFNEVLQKAVTLGIQLGVKPIREGTKDARNFSLRLRSTTSADGSFSDLQDEITKKFGADMAADVMTRPVTVIVDVEVSAKIAGTELTKVGGPIPAGAVASE